MSHRKCPVNICGMRDGTYVGAELVQSSCLYGSQNLVFIELSLYLYSSCLNSSHMFNPCIHLTNEDVVFQTLQCLTIFCMLYFSDSVVAHKTLCCITQTVQLLTVLYMLYFSDAKRLTILCVVFLRLCSCLQSFICCISQTLPWFHYIMYVVCLRPCKGAQHFLRLCSGSQYFVYCIPQNLQWLLILCTLYS